MPPPDPTPTPPPVITDRANPTPPSPVPQQNPWVLSHVAPEVGSLHIEYVSTRAMGLRGERVAARNHPFTYIFGIVIWTFFIGGFIMRYANGNTALAIALALLASLLLNTLMIGGTLLARYPTANSTRKLSYTLQPTGIHGRNPQGTTFKPWKELQSVKRIEDTLIFNYGVMAIAYMPIEAFHDDASAERFMQAVRDLKAANGNFAVISPELRAEFAPSI